MYPTDHTCVSNPEIKADGTSYEREPRIVQVLVSFVRIS
jgi:hypothetical protein